MKKKVVDIVVCCMLLFISADGQTAGYLYEANVDSIKHPGFYNIVLTPAIAAHLKTDFSDFRIVNKNGKWIPHLIRKPNTERHIESLIMNLPVIKKETKGAVTELIVKTDSNILSNLVLQIKNTDAERFGSLAGSDDVKDWFTINDSILIQPQQSENNTAAFSIHFPQVNYKYYRLIIYNMGRAPFYITSVGYQTPAKGPGITDMLLPIENPATVLAQKDSGKISFIRVTQKDNYRFDEISLKVSGPAYFNRVADVYVPVTTAHSFSNPGRLLQSINISNNSTLNYKLPAMNAVVFYLLVHNQDNPAVKVDTVTTSYSYTVATAYLETNEAYKILLDNASAEAPEYDLQQLNIANKNSLPEITIGEIIAAPKTTAIEKAGQNNRWIIWIVIAIAAAILAFFSYKLVAEMNKSKA